MFTELAHQEPIILKSRGFIVPWPEGVREVEWTFKFQFDDGKMARFSGCRVGECESPSCWQVRVFALLPVPKTIILLVN
jgi:hypothetical protein